MPSASRPNILLIMTDQQSADTLSCAGNRYIRTPAMDRLAASGVRFEKAYCTTPLCVPSRMSAMTGRMPREVGAAINFKPQPDAPHVPVLGRVLADAGYDPALVGKWHLTFDTEAADIHGFSFPGPVRNNRVDFDIVDGCRGFLEKRREDPFFLAANFVNPHDICQWARGEELPNGPIPAAPPPEECPPLPDNFTPPEGEPSVLREKVQPTHPKAYPTINWDEGRWRQYRWAYFQLVQKVDADIGRLLELLEETGNARNTVVIFTSDHGDGSAHHRWNQKQVLYDETARIPFIVSDPEGPDGTADHNHLVSMGLDLLPTVCDYAGTAVPDGLRGRSVRPLARGQKPAWREQIVIDTEFCSFGETTGITGRALRTHQFKYTVYSEGERREQLFDMNTDPGELENLAANVSYRHVLEEHRSKLRAWCAETADTFAVPDT